MIKIFIPDNFINERKYVLDIVFNTFLGLSFIVNSHIKPDTVIELPDGNKIIIVDHFFSKLSDTYLDISNIPATVAFQKNKFTINSDIPVIYGDDFMEIILEHIKTGIDIFASIFFMLSRFEEIVCVKRDIHGRFSEKESLAYKNNFLNRPVVNEYIEMLWNMLIKLGFKGSRKTKKFYINPTHDIDDVYFKNSIKNIAGEIVKRGNVKTAIKRINYKINHINLYDSFNYLMDISEKNNLKSTFYFMSGGNSKYDNSYKITDDFIKNTINIIKTRGHTLGYHTSYNAFENPEMFGNEISLIEKNYDIEIKNTRNHFLRFDFKKTPVIFMENRIEFDSTLGFAGSDGYRCGTGDSFNLFDVFNRQKLSTCELPLILMDRTFIKYKQIKFYDIIDKIDYYKKISKNYNMPFTILFHNSIFNDLELPRSKEIYEYIFQ